MIRSTFCAVRVRSWPECKVRLLFCVLQRRVKTNARRNAQCNQRQKPLGETREVRLTFVWCLRRHLGVSYWHCLLELELWISAWTVDAVPKEECTKVPAPIDCLSLANGSQLSAQCKFVACSTLKTASRPCPAPPRSERCEHRPIKSRSSTIHASMRRAGKPASNRNNGSGGW